MYDLQPLRGLNEGRTFRELMIRKMVDLPLRSKWNSPGGKNSLTGHNYPCKIVRPAASAKGPKHTS
jgi:hypothetical protein